MTTIDDLPDEIIKQIFQSLPPNKRKEGRKNLLLVSKRFKALADDTIGLEVFVGQPPWSGWEAAAGTDHIAFSQIQEIGVSVCHVGELMDISPQSQGFVSAVKRIWGKVMSFIYTQSLPTFKHPHLLSIIRFSGIIRDEYFQTLINPSNTYYLRRFQINHSALSLLEPTSLVNLEFKSLELLEVTADFAYIFRNIDDSKILTNILALLQNSIPRLISVNIYMPFDSKKELETSKAFFRFIAMNSTHLKFLELIYFYMLSEDFDVYNEDEPDIIDGELEQLSLQASESMQLQAVILHLNVDRMRCLSYWSRLLAHQTNLEYFVVLSEHQIFTTTLIQNIAHCLRIIFACVDTRGNDGQATPLDSQLFHHCNQLSHMSVKGRYDNFMLLNTTPGMINVEMLPNSLRHIDISRIPVLTTDLRHILLDMPGLQHFVAKFVGRTGSMGVTMDILLEVLYRRQLNWFLLVASIRGEFPEEGLNNGHPSRPTALFLDEETFCVKLGRSGYYIMGSPFDDIQNSLNLRARIGFRAD